MKKFIIGFVVVIMLMAIIIGNCTNDSDVYEDLVPDVESDEVEVTNDEEVPAADDAEELPMTMEFDTTAMEIPKAEKSFPEQILVRYAYTTSYNKLTKCPNWVAWHLTRDRCDGPYSRKGVPYYDDNNKVYGIGFVTQETSRGDYLVDTEVPSPRQEFSDWADKSIPNNSHGHICPAADCKWSKEAMNQSFLLTNMCPQDMTLNGGDWEKLENKCRNWAKKYGDVFIVAGPVFYNGIRRTMGDNKVGVPDAFYKVVLCLQGEPKAIGFIYPNTDVHHEMKEYVKSVDEVEKITGINFFHNLQDDIENKIESESNLNIWR